MYKKTKSVGPSHLTPHVMLFSLFSPLIIVVLTLFRRLPRLPLVSEHLLLHVPHCPGRPGLVVQGALLEVSRAQPQSYPGHEGALAGLEEEEGEEPTE